MAHVKPAGWKIAALALPCWVFLAFLPGSPAWGQKEKAKEEGDIPLHITAARLEADQEKRLIIFSGQVKAQRGEAILYSDQLLVYYQPGPEATSKAEKPEKGASPLGDLGGEKIDRIEAKGRVRFVQADRVATGEQAIYYQAKDEVVLLGHPQVWRGESNLKGERIVFHLKDNRVTVESSPQQRVEAHLYQTQGPTAAGQGFLPGLSGEQSRPKPRRP